MENHSESIYPNAKVRVEKAQYSISHLKKLVEERGEVVINPGFQREYVWKEKQKSELVESVLMGIPIPIFYLFEDKYGKKQVVDGRQRITTLIDFLDNKFILKDLKILPILNGKRFRDLESKLQGIFEDYQLFFYIIQPPTSERVKYDIFDRVNRGGTKLSNQEMRNALYFGRATDMLCRIAKSKEYLDATSSGISPIRKKDEQVVLRTLAFYMLFSGMLSFEYKNDMEDFLAKVMSFINEELTDLEAYQIESIIRKALVNIHQHLDNDAFRFPPTKDGRRRPINMLLVETITVMFMEEGRLALSIPREDWNAFRSSCDMDESFKSGTDAFSMIQRRRRMAQDFLSKYRQ